MRSACSVQLFSLSCHRQQCFTLMASTISFDGANSGFQAGVVNGPVHNKFHLSPKRPETPPDPSSNVPFRRDQDFVERETLLRKINQKCAMPGSWPALVGLGGVGWYRPLIPRQQISTRNRICLPNSRTISTNMCSLGSCEQSSPF